MPGWYSSGVWIDGTDCWMGGVDACEYIGGTFAAGDGEK